MQHNKENAPDVPMHQKMLDVMTLVQLDKLEEEQDVETAPEEAEALMDAASAQYHLKIDLIQKSVSESFNDQQLRLGKATQPSLSEVENERQMVAKHRKVLNVEEEVDALAELIRRCHADGLPNLMDEQSSELISIDADLEESVRIHEKNCFQAVLLQRLCDQVNIPSDKEEYIDNLCNSVLSGAYDFLDME